MAISKNVNVADGGGNRGPVASSAKPMPAAVVKKPQMKQGTGTAVVSSIAQKKPVGQSITQKKPAGASKKTGSMSVIPGQKAKKTTNKKASFGMAGASASAGRSQNMTQKKPVSQSIAQQKPKK